MRAASGLHALCLVLVACSARAPGGVGFDLVRPADYAVFVGRWAAQPVPFCAVITSPAEWARVMHPAAVMGAHKPYVPSADFWARHSAILVLAQLMPGGDASDVFQVRRVTQTQAGLVVDYDVHTPPPASYQMAAWFGVAISAKLPPAVIFRTESQPVCQLKVTRPEPRLLQHMGAKS